MSEESTPLPSPPFIDVEGIANFRDIGGYETTGDKQHSIRRNLVFRCADPSKVSASGLSRLRSLGVKKVFDLRSVPEIQRQGPEWKGVEVDASDAFVTRSGQRQQDDVEVEDDRIERVWCPVFADADYGPEKVALRYSQYARSGSEGFIQAYGDILTNGTTAYKTILLHLAQPNPEPCIVHCTAGKDRTGVIIALLYLLCQVPAATVAQEYSLTDLGLQHLKPLFSERLLKNPALAGNEEGVRNMIGSREGNMRGTIELIERRYGGAEGYVLGPVGLSRQELERLRGNLVVEVAPVLSTL